MLTSLVDRFVELARFQQALEDFRVEALEMMKNIVKKETE